MKNERNNELADKLSAQKNGIFGLTREGRGPSQI